MLGNFNEEPGSVCEVNEVNMDFHFSLFAGPRSATCTYSAYQSAFSVVLLNQGSFGTSYISGSLSCRWVLQAPAGMVRTDINIS